MYPDRGVYSSRAIPASLCTLGSENKKLGTQKGLGTGTRRTIRVEKLRGNNLLGEWECTGNRKIRQTGRNQILGRCPQRGSKGCLRREVGVGGGAGREDTLPALGGPRVPLGCDSKGKGASQWG